MADPSPWNDAFEQAAHRVLAADTGNFAKLIKLSGLDPKRHLRFGDWSQVSFRDSDLRGFDFTGARLVGCDFTGAQIAGARFEQAEIDHLRWRRARILPPDDHLPIGAVFQDAPYGPPMVVLSRGPFATRLKSHRTDFRRADDPPFAVARFPLSNDEIAVFAEARQVHITSFLEGGRFPGSAAVQVPWDVAVSYVLWLAEKTGQPYRLLSVLDWEHLERVGATSSLWPGGGVEPTYHGEVVAQPSGESLWQRGTMHARSNNLVRVRIARPYTTVPNPYE